MTRLGVCPDGQTQVPSYRGLDYLGSYLASDGIAAISIDPLFLNNASALPDDLFLGLARARVRVLGSLTEL